MDESIIGMDILSFLGREAGNSYKSIAILGEDLRPIKKLGEILESLLQGTNLLYDNKNDKAFIKALNMLTYFIHYQYFFSMGCLLRGHISNGLSSIRAAIDAALSLNIIINESGSENLYLERHPSFQSAKSTIRKSVFEGSDGYQLAVPLMKIHDYCCEFGSHADVSTFMNRMAEEDIVIDGHEGLDLELSYTQFPKDDPDNTEIHLISLSFAHIFMLISRLLVTIFKTKSMSKCQDIERGIADCDKEIITLANKHNCTNEIIRGEYFF